MNVIRNVERSDACKNREIASSGAARSLSTVTPGANRRGIAAANASPSVEFSSPEREGQRTAEITEDVAVRLGDRPGFRAEEAP